MQFNYAVYGKLKNYLFDVLARNEEEAMWKASGLDIKAEFVKLIVPGGDLGVNGVN